jgi:D-amino peptidase
MRVYLSVDIEGVAGISHWDEATKAHADYSRFQDQMVAEAVAACEGALAAGATTITVKDAHDSGRNIPAGSLPRPTELISGWSGHPFSMVQGLDDSYDAAAFIGYHAKAGDGGNPLSHTMTGRIHQLVINGEPVAEYHLHANAAALVGVPVVFVSGDRTLCHDIATTQPATTTFATKWGEGPSQHTVHPETAVEGIRAGMQAGLEGDLGAARLELPDRFEVDLHYKHHTTAYEKSFYPGATLTGPHTVRLEADDFFDVLRALQFLL